MLSRRIGCANQSSRGNAKGFKIALLGLIFFGIVLGMQSNAFADQDDQPGPGMGGHRGQRQMPSVDDQVKRLTQQLSLSDDQQAKVKTILEGQRKQMEQLRNDTALSRQDRFSKMRELHEQTTTQIKGALNDDQQKKFDKMQQERRERWKHGEGGEGKGSDDKQ